MAINVPVQGMQELQLILDIIKDQKKFAEALKTLQDARAELYSTVDDVNKLKRADELLKHAMAERDAANAARAEAQDYARKLRAQADESFVKREQAARDAEVSLGKARDEFNAECKEKRAAMDKQLADIEKREADLSVREKNVLDIQVRYTDSLNAAEANRKALEGAMKKLGVA